MKTPSTPFQRALKSPPFLGALLFLALGMFASESAEAFGKKPVTLPPVPPVTPIQPSGPTNPADVIRARWDGVTQDGSAWSQHVYDSIPLLAPNLLSHNPNDIAQFCPGYSALSVSDKKNFWVYLLSSLAQLESDFDPNASYTENFKDQNGNYVVSLGLLQLSLGDGANYKCGFSSNADIENPDKNLDCSLRILNKLVGQNGQLAGQSGAGAWQGGARYWSTLRAPKVSTVEGWTRALPICAQ
ncbi:MAG: transglycosylase SLT domain-containing protein [Bdellovibrionota bacterium]